MSFLSILLVASAFYLGHARPQFQPEASDVAYANDGGWLKLARDFSIPVPDLQNYQRDFFGYMQDIEKTVDQYIMSLKKQEELKSMGLDGFANYANYLFGRQ